MSEQKTTVVESENVASESTPKNEFEGITANTREFNELATERLNKDLALTLANGTNPSAKYLRQSIESKHLPEQITKFLNDILGFMEFVDAGQGVEYVLTSMGTITQMDPDAFVPTEVYEMANHTHVDTITLPAIGSTQTKAVERSVALYKYVQYYLSGKAAQVAEVIKSYMQDSMLLSVFQDLLAIIQRMYAVISAKSTTGTNYVVGTATNPVDAMRELKNMATKMLSFNTTFNWGVDDGSTHTDFTSAPNFCTSGSLKFITDYRTWNNIKKILPTVFHDDKLAKNLLGDESNWVIVPTSYLDVSPVAAHPRQINEQPTLVENFQLFQDSSSNRKPGTVMIIQKNDIKAAYNFEQNESAYYPKNAVTQVFMKKNLKLKALKWAQVGVFENSHLEDDFVVPTV